MITVADVMTTRPVTVSADATVAEALDAMRDRGASSVLVLPPAGSTEYGVVTKRDIVWKIVGQHLDPAALRVEDITSWRLVTASRHWTIEQAASVMAEAGVRRLPVAGRGGVVGLVSDTDIFTALVPRQEWESVRLVRKERALRRASRPGAAKTVADLMSAPVLTIRVGATVLVAAKKMVASGVSSLLSLTGRGARGIVTKRDVVTKVVARGRDVEQVTVTDIMSAPLRTIELTATLEDCATRMEAQGVRRFPVIQDGHIAGIISDTDILAAVEAHRWSGLRRPTGPTSYIVADVMTPATMPLKPTGMDGVPPELSIWECAARLAQSGVARLPVVQEGEVIGTVSETDLVAAIQERGGGE